MNKKNIILGIILFILIIGIFLVLTTNNDTKARLIELDYEEVLEKMDNEDDFILVITQSTCSHCATYKPKLKEISKSYEIDIFYINIDLMGRDNEEKFLKDSNLSGATPTTIFIKEGTESSVLNRMEGDVTVKKAIEKFKKMGFIEE